MTEAELVAHYTGVCKVCKAEATRPRWYALCPTHAPVARAVLDPAYEGALVRSKFYHMGQVEQQPAAQALVTFYTERLALIAAGREALR